MEWLRVRQLELMPGSARARVLLEVRAVLCHAVQCDATRNGQMPMPML